MTLFPGSSAAIGSAAIAIWPGPHIALDVSRGCRSYLCEVVEHELAFIAAQANYSELSKASIPHRLKGKSIELPFVEVLEVLQHPHLSLDSRLGKPHKLCLDNSENGTGVLFHITQKAMLPE